MTETEDLAGAAAAREARVSIDAGEPLIPWEQVKAEIEPVTLLRLNLGCGPIILPDTVNVDIVPLPGVDVVTDLDQPWPWADETVSEILASHLFEHVASPVLFMAEAWRVLAPGGGLDIRVPYYRHVFAFTDPTHRRFCTELTFDYWIPGTGLHDAYGPGFGSVKGGPRFGREGMFLVGEQQEELRVVLRKLGDED